MPADPRELLRVEHVGRDLAEEVDAQRPVDRYEAPIASDDVGGVHGFNRQESDILISIEPAVELPSIETHPISQTVTLGETASFEVSVKGRPPFSYQWRKDGIDIDGATLPTYAINDVQPLDEGSYDVLVSNALAAA